MRHFAQGTADFGWAIRAARYLLAWQNPYDTPLEQYPMTAGLFGLPFVKERDEIFFRLDGTGSFPLGLRQIHLVLLPPPNSTVVPLAGFSLIPQSAVGRHRGKRIDLV